MMWIKAIRKRYAPIHLALFFSLPSVALVIAAMFLRTGYSATQPAVVFVAGIVAFNVGFYLAVCPTCQKSVLRRNWVKKTNLFHPIAYSMRIIPERVCADCGTRLDEIPPAQQQDTTETLP